MDVCDGVFPDKVVYSKKATPQEKKEFEEERRLFYVGMTRAKSVLHVFRLSEETSSFIREMTSAKVEKMEGVKPDQMKKAEGAKLDQGKMKLKLKGAELYSVKNLNGMEFDSVKSGSVKPDGLKLPDRVKLQDEKRVEGTEIRLVIGERVEQMKYGMGVISDAVYHADGITGKFTVLFDSGLEKNFLYPVAFQMGMRIVTEEETGKEGQA